MRPPATFADKRIQLQLGKHQTTLAADQLDDAAIETKLYYDAPYFRARVPRVVLPPRQLYKRVRAVFELFDPMVDARTNVPLFNSKNWGRANNVLKEILAGNASDPPGVSFYTQQLDAKGQPAVDAHGIALLGCSRGTNDTECIQQIVTTFGTWHTGVEMADKLMAERRHRYTHRVSERRRLGFPKLGHFDTWLIDQLQLLVEFNHRVLLHTDWSNASEYASIEESFGTVVLHSPKLAAAIDAIEVDMSKVSLSSDQRYLCRVQKTKLPLLLAHGAAECQLFERLVLKLSNGLNFDAMALEWCEKVDGRSIFPKLPVYLRTQ